MKGNSETIPQVILLKSVLVTKEYFFYQPISFFDMEEKCTIGKNSDKKFHNKKEFTRHGISYTLVSYVSR